MKPPPFEYARPDTVDRVLEILASSPEARVLAGGQSLLPLLNLRLASPDVVIDIGRIPELQAIAVDAEGLTIGAAAVQADVAADPRVRERWPLVAAAIACIGHPQIRNRGTVCGSLAHNDPLAELPAVAVALGARMIVRSAGGERTIPADEMFVGPFMTALDQGDLLVGVRFPSPPDRAGWSVREFAPRPGDFATAGVVTNLVADGSTVAEAGVLLFGLGGSPLRATVVEDAVVGSPEPVVDAALREALARSLDPPDDVHASADTRRHLAGVLVAESVAEAWERTP